MYLQKATSIICWQLEGHYRNEKSRILSAEPDLKGTDPRIRIRAKMSRIWNTA